MQDKELFSRKIYISGHKGGKVEAVVELDPDTLLEN